MKKRPLFMATTLLTAAAAMGGCGVSVAAGGRNAATHPASGIFTSNTVGGGNDTSDTSQPTVTYIAPGTKPPATPPPGSGAAVNAIKGALSGGCWADDHVGNSYGAYDQLFWYEGECGDTVAGVTLELFSSAAAARAHKGHAASLPLSARYLDGPVLVDVWASAPSTVGAELADIKRLRALPGYGG